MLIGITLLHTSDRRNLITSSTQSTLFFVWRDDRKLVLYRREVITYYVSNKSRTINTMYVPLSKDVMSIYWKHVIGKDSVESDSPLTKSSPGTASLRAK